MPVVLNFFSSTTIFNHFCLLSGCFSYYLVMVKEIFIILTFFAKLLQNVWNMLDLSCMNYFLNIFPCMSSLENFWIFWIISNKQIIYLTYDTGRLLSMAFSCRGMQPATPWNPESLLHTSCEPDNLLEHFYLFSPLGLEISQRRLLEPISLSTLFQDLVTFLIICIIGLMPTNFQFLVLLTFEWTGPFSQYDDTDEVCFHFRLDSAIQVQPSTSIPIFCLFIKMPR